MPSPSGTVGPPGAALGVGVPVNPRFGPQQDMSMSPLHGRYHEQARLGNVFQAANQSAQTTTVGLALTYTGLCLSNPVGSGKNVTLLQVMVALGAAPAAIDPILLACGYNAGTNVTHTTPVTPQNALTGGASGVALADVAATLPTAPVYRMPIMGGFTAAALPSTSPGIIQVEGAIILPPGGYCIIATVGVVTSGIWGGFTWEENPI